MTLNPELEQKLVEEAKTNKDAFGKLYQHYFPQIRKFFVYKVHDDALAEDLTSKVFESALNSIYNFKWQGISFSAWLYRIARNSLIDFYRITSKRKITSLDEGNELSSSLAIPHEAAEIYFEQEILREVIEELEERERAIVYMKFFDGYKNKTIAEVTGLSETNIGTIIYRVINKLRTKLDEKGYKK